MRNNEAEMTRSRLDVACEHFTAACLPLQAGERAFQEWFTACVISEFGLTFVAREVHIDKDDIRRTGVGERMGEWAHELNGNEFFPDLLVSRTVLDRRHSATRDGISSTRLLADARAVLDLKVTGSSKASRGAAIAKDVRKLAVLQRLAMSTLSGDAGEPPLARVVVLDNDGCYSDQAVENIAADIERQLPTELVDGLPLDVWLCHWSPSIHAPQRRPTAKVLRSASSRVAVPALPA